jgi:hypothetical protein
MAEAVHWGKRGARINTISPGIVITPLAKDELTGPRGDGYRRMIESSPVGRAGTPDEVGAVSALLMGPDGGFITGSDFLMDGGVTAAYWYGEVAEVRNRDGAAETGPACCFQLTIATTALTAPLSPRNVDHGDAIRTLLSVATQKVAARHQGFRDDPGAPLLRTA